MNQCRQQMYTGTMNSFDDQVISERKVNGEQKNQVLRIRRKQKSRVKKEEKKGRGSRRRRRRRKIRIDNERDSVKASMNAHL